MNTSELSDLDIRCIAVASTIGHSMLIETLKMAAFYVTHSSSTPSYRNFKTKFNESAECYTFVQGTGLQLAINRYGMLYDADEIRSVFHYCIRHSQ